MIKAILFVSILIWINTLCALSQEQAELFLHDFTDQTTNLKQWIHPDEITACNRLGISYEGIDLKEFISYTLPVKVKGAKHNFRIEEIDENNTKLQLSFPQENYKTTLFFKDDLYISPIYFHTRNWTIIESKYFRFIISNENLINEYSIQNLEKFLLYTMDLLDYSENDKKTLKQSKIDYVLCKDATEIEKITGFNTRGIYLLAQDCVVSIFNSHYHELAHLLINYKLKKLTLYTLPFLQEGFAVAVGGRGGKEPEVILDMGKFLVDSEYLNYIDLLSKQDFYNVDPSLSYPVSGLYNRFLIEQLGINNYLEFYHNYSSSDPEITAIPKADLPAEKCWNKFVRECDFSQIWLEDESDYVSFLHDEYYDFSENTVGYRVKIKGSILLNNELIKSYKSSIYEMKFPNRIYNGEKYLIQVSEEEVMIYNLYTNNLIADYSSGFSPDFKPVPKDDGYYKFYFSKKIFVYSLGDIIILNEKNISKE